MCKLGEGAIRHSKLSGQVGSGLVALIGSWVKQVELKKQAILNGLKAGWAKRVTEGFGPTRIYTKKRKTKQINAKFLERINQINQGNKLYIISSLFLLSGNLLLLDYLCYYYTCKGGKKNHKT